MIRPEDDMSREKALQAVVAGNQAENLLDFDMDEPSSSSTQSNNTLVSDGVISSRAIASAAKSTNPLDELMDLFSTASMTAPDTQPVMSSGNGMGMGMGNGLDSLGGFGGTSSPAPVPVAPQYAAPPKPQSQGQSKPDEDLMGLF